MGRWRRSSAAVRRARRRLNRNPWPVVVRRSGVAARLPAFHLRQPERADRRPAVAADHRNERQPELRHLRHPQYLFVEGQWRGRHVGHFRHADDRQRRRTQFGLRPARPIGAGFARQARLPLQAASRGALLRRFESDGGRRRLFAQRAERQGPPDLRPAPEGGRIGRSRRRRHRPRAVCPGAQPRRASDRRRHADVSRRRGGRGATSPPRRSMRRWVQAPTR